MGILGGVTLEERTLAGLGGEGEAEVEGALSPHSSKHASMTSRSGTGAPLSLSQECTGLERINF